MLLCIAMKMRGSLNAALTCERPDAGALELLQEGELSADHWDWECGAGFRFARDEDVQEESAAKAPPPRCVFCFIVWCMVSAASTGLQSLRTLNRLA